MLKITLVDIDLPAERGNHAGKTARQRFWNRIDKTDNCWKWNGCKNHCGYGTIRVMTKTVLAPRLSWVIHFGEIPIGLHVLHKCDNPECTRPDHLWLGTMKDNCIDRSKKGRSGDRIGEKHGRAKLNDSKVREIRLRNKNNESITSLAKEFGVSDAAVWFVVNRMTWKHVS